MANFFSKLDLTKGYWQIPLSTGSHKKSALSTAIRVVWGPAHVPASHGPGIAPAHGVCGSMDVIIHSDTWPQHLHWVVAVLESLRKAGLTAEVSNWMEGGTEFGVPFGLRKSASAAG